MKKQISVRVDESKQKELKRKLTASDSSIQQFLEEKINDFLDDEKKENKEKVGPVSRIMKEENPIWLQADLRKRLIEMNKTIDSELAHFEVLLPTASDEILINLLPSIKVTCKKMFENYNKMSHTIIEVEQIKNTYNIERKGRNKKMGSLLDRVRHKVSFKEDIIGNDTFSSEEKSKIIRDLILTYVAENHKLRFTHYDKEFEIDKKNTATGRMMAISLPGRQHAKAPMTQFINELAESTDREDFSINIIKYTIEAMSNFLEELESSNNRQRKKKYAKLFEDERLIRLFIIIGIIQAGNYCISNEIDLNHAYFQTVLENAKVNQSKLSKFYRDYNNDKITYEELEQKVDEIYSNFKKEFEERIYGEVQGKIMVEIGQLKQDLADIGDLENIEAYISYIGISAMRSVKKYSQRTLNEQVTMSSLGLDTSYEF